MINQCIENGLFRYFLLLRTLHDLLSLELSSFPSPDSFLDMASRSVRKIISIDAFNTLFAPTRPILIQYVEFAQNNGFNHNIDENELTLKFPKVFNELRQKYPNYGKNVLPGGYESWWRKLIIELYSPLELDDSFIAGLINWFDGSKAYSTYSDVIDFLTRVHQRRDFIVVCSSNGDPRVIKILESLDLLKFFDEMYISYDIGVSKPNKEFFNYIVDHIVMKYGGENKEPLTNNSWHIGDELKNDLNGSVGSGWNGVLVDRTSEFHEVKKLDIDLSKFKQDIPLKVREKIYVSTSFKHLYSLID